MHRTEASPGSDKSFGIVFAVVFFLLALLPLLHGRPVHVWALIVSLSFLAAAYICPTQLAPLNRLWFKFGLLLHHVISPVVLFLVFTITIIPAGLIMRIIGRDPLHRKFDPQAKTYWVHRHPTGKPDNSMRNQF